MKITKAEQKNFLIDIILFDDDLTTDGKRSIRRTFPRSCYSGAVKAKFKILADMWVEVDGVECKSSDAPKDKKIVKEFFKDSDLEFTDVERKALRELWETRSDLPVMSSLEVFEELERLVYDKK